MHCRSPLDRALRPQPAFVSPAVALQPSLLQMTPAGRLIDAQTLPLNNSATVSALLSQAENPQYVSPLIIEPYLVPPSPPPPRSWPPPPAVRSANDVSYQVHSQVAVL